MPVTVGHVLTATTPDDPAYEIRPSHWNSNHAVTFSPTGAEIIGAFSNENNVSFSTNGAGFVVASANVTAAPSPVNVTGANGSSVNAQTLAFSNANGMTLGVSTAANGATVTGSYTVPTVPTAYVSSVNGSSGAISLNVGSSLSSSTNGSSITFGLASNITTALQSANANYLTSQSNQAVSANNGSYAFQTLSFSNANGISFGTSAGSAITASHNALTTARASNDAVGLNTAQSNVTWTVNSAGLSLDARGYAGTATAVTGNASVTLNSAGLSFNGSNLAGVGTSATNASITLNSNGLAISVAAPGGGAGDGFNILAAGTQTAGTATTVNFANSNGITFGMSGSSQITASHNGLTSQSNQAVSAANGSYAFQTLSFSNANGISFGTSAGSAITASHNGLTTARASNDAIGLNTAQTNVTWTVNSSGLSLNAAGYAGTGTSVSGAASITLNSNGLQFNGNGLAGTATGFTGANISGSMTHNTAGLSLSLSVAAGGGVNPVASASNGSFSFTTLAFSNANNVTFGTSAGSIITASVAAPGAAAEQNAINLLGANTAGNTTATGSTIGWSGINLTFSGANNSQVVVSAPATSSLVATGIASISTNGSTISIGVPAGTATMWQPFNEGVNVAGQIGNASLHIVPLPTPVPAALGELQVDRICIPLYFTNASNSTGTISCSYGMGLYTKNVSSLSLAMSTSYSTAWTFSGTNSASLHHGIRLHTVPWTTTIGDGRYYVAQWTRTSSGGANGSFSQMLVSQINSNFSGVFGAASNRSAQWPLGYGIYSATTTGMPSSIAFSQIDGTASIAARPPSFFMINGTA